MIRCRGNFLELFNTMYFFQKNLMGLGYTNGLALRQELKKSEDIARSIAEFLVNITDTKNPDINNIHEAIYQRIKTCV